MYKISSKSVHICMHSETPNENSAIQHLRTRLKIGWRGVPLSFEAQSWCRENMASFYRTNCWHVMECRLLWSGYPSPDRVGTISMEMKARGCRGVVNKGLSHTVTDGEPCHTKPALIAPICL